MKNCWNYSSKNFWYLRGIEDVVMQPNVSQPNDSDKLIISNRLAIQRRPGVIDELLFEKILIEKQKQKNIVPVAFAYYHKTRSYYLTSESDRSTILEYHIYSREIVQLLTIENTNIGSISVLKDSLFALDINGKNIIKVDMSGGYLRSASTENFSIRGFTNINGQTRFIIWAKKRGSFNIMLWNQNELGIWIGTEKNNEILFSELKEFSKILPSHAIFDTVTDRIYLTDSKMAELYEINPNNFQNIRPLLEGNIIQRPSGVAYFRFFENDLTENIKKVYGNYSSLVESNSFLLICDIRTNVVFTFDLRTKEIYPLVGKLYDSIEPSLDNMLCYELKNANEVFVGSEGAIFLGSFGQQTWEILQPRIGENAGQVNLNSAGIKFT